MLLRYTSIENIQFSEITIYIFLLKRTSYSYCAIQRIHTRETPALKYNLLPLGYEFNPLTHVHSGVTT